MKKSNYPYNLIEDIGKSYNLVNLARSNMIVLNMDLLLKSLTLDDKKLVYMRYNKEISTKTIYSLLGEPSIAYVTYRIDNILKKIKNNAPYECLGMFSIKTLGLSEKVTNLLIQYGCYDILDIILLNEDIKDIPEFDESDYSEITECIINLHM